MKELLDKYTNEHSRFMNLHGVQVHYRDEGEGYPLVLIHGAFASLHTFDRWAEILSKHYRVIRMDLPGFGLTGPNGTNTYSIKYHTRMLSQFLNNLKVYECHLAGSSLGGWISWEYALHFPERVQKLILIGAAGFISETPVPLPFKMARTPFLNKIMRFAVKKNVLATFLNDVYHDKSKVTEDLIDRYYDLFTRKGNIEAFFKMVNAKPIDNSHKLHQLRHNTLIQWGREDAWLPVANAYKFREQIPKSSLIVYDHMGHIPMEEEPDLTAADARSFLLHNWH